MSIINIKHLVHGDKEAWDSFVERYSPVIYSTVLKVFQIYTTIINKCDINDVVQEIFFRLIKNNFKLLKTFNSSKSSLPTWLTIVSRSAAIDFFRRQKIQTVPLEGEVADAAISEKITRPSIDIPYDLLSPRQKLILTLIFEKEMDTSEIAELLNINTQTVRSAKHKALAKLRKFFHRSSNLDNS